MDEYLEQTAIANPHVTLHYIDPEGNESRLPAVGRPAAAGAEGDQAASVRRRAGPAGRRCCTRAEGDTIAQFLTSNVLARHAGSGPQDLQHGQDFARASSTQRIGRQGSRRAVSGDSGDARSRRRRPTASRPIGEELILKGLHQVVPGEFYAAATRPPAVYRGNPFQIEVGLAYGGAGGDAERRRRICCASCSRKPTPARSGSS